MKCWGRIFSPAHFRSRIEDFYHRAPGGWPCWAFSNHDVPRHVGRWLDHAADQDALARQAAALLLSFEGSICIYQGEELGLVDTELSFDELTDPEGITFWPEAKGRDGCRTPMVWDAAAPNAGFSTANATWLPVKAPQRDRAVSTQSGRGQRAGLLPPDAGPAPGRVDLRLGRMRFHDLPEPLLGYDRGDGFTCIFNLSPHPRAPTCRMRSRRCWTRARRSRAAICGWRPMGSSSPARAGG